MRVCQSGADNAVNRGNADSSLEPLLATFLPAQKRFRPMLNVADSQTEKGNMYIYSVL